MLDKVRDLKGLALREVRSLELPAGGPQGIELGLGRREGGRAVALVASVRDGLDLIGWGELAGTLAGDQAAVSEVIVAAPLLSEETRRAAQRAALGRLPIRLVVIPALADSSEEVLDQELLPQGEHPFAGGGASAPLLDRVVSVLAGAASVASCGDVRVFRGTYLLYMRGKCVLRVDSEGDGAALSFLAPEPKLVHVSDSNFSRWGGELHEAVLALAQDPRLLGSEEAGRDDAIDRAADDAGARITARWIPWNSDGAAAAEWAGVDFERRPVVGVIRGSVNLAHAPGLIALLHLVAGAPERWTPGSSGAPRLHISSERVDDRLIGFLRECGIVVSTSGAAKAPAVPRAPAAPAAAVDEPEGEPRGRRRPRRRRRGRGDRSWREGERESTDTEESEASLSEEPSAADAVAEESEPRDSREHFEPERAEYQEERELAGAEDEEEETAAAEADEGELLAEASGAESEESFDAREAPLEGEEEPEGFEAEGATEEGELEAAGDGEAGDSESGDGESAPAASTDDEPREVVRQRSSRAAVVVRDDPDAILAALVLARDRRSIVSFRVVRQEELMDFFRGSANDLPDNADLLLVGLTAQPTPFEIIQTAELFRGRLEWYDNHEWPIEDIERLREAIGRDGIFFEAGAASPLASIVKTTERRSRFTDKLVDLGARRLSENDMAKWGYRVMGMLQKLARSPGEHRSEVTAVLTGKPTELPEVETVYADEQAWMQSHEPRVVHFGEYQMVVLRVPPHLDAGEIGRRERLRTGARLSLTSREDDDLIMLGCNDERRHVNVLGLVDQVSASLPWAEAAIGGDRVGRLRVENLSQHPERLDALVGEIVRHRSILYG